MRMQTLVLMLLAAGAAGRLMAADTEKQEASSTVAWLQFIGTELRELRRELLDDRIERQETRVRALERELLMARSSRQRGEEAQRTQSQEIIRLDQQLASAGLPPEERAQLESVRAELTATGTGQRQAPGAEEAQLSERLRTEQGRLEKLKAVARSLTPSAAGSQR